MENLSSSKFFHQWQHSLVILTDTLYCNWLKGQLKEEISIAPVHQNTGRKLNGLGFNLGVFIQPLIAGPSAYVSVVSVLAVPVSIRSVPQKNLTKRSSNTLLCLVRFSTEQTFTVAQQSFHIREDTKRSNFKVSLYLIKFMTNSSAHLANLD